MRIYKKITHKRGGLRVNTSVEGKTLEQKIEQIMSNGDKIEAEAELIYTDRKDGVVSGHNIRTDRFEVAVDAIGRTERAETAKRDNVAKLDIVKDDEKPSGTEGEEG